jgi:hypothetical protein
MRGSPFGADRRVRRWPIQARRGTKAAWMTSHRIMMATEGMFEQGMREGGALHGNDGACFDYSCCAYCWLRRPPAPKG